MNKAKLSPWGQKKFSVNYLSGQSVLVYGDSLEEVTERETALIEGFKRFNPNIGIADISEVAE